MRDSKGIFAGLNLAAIAACCLATGCVAGTSADGSSGVTANQPMKITGALLTNIDSKDINIDYTGQGATVTMVHRINKDSSGLACVPEVNLDFALADKSCELQLGFKAGLEGEGLKLSSATFAARKGVYQSQDGSNVLIDTLPCSAWTTEPAKGEVLYQYDSGDATLPFSPLKQPQAGEAKANLTALFLQPQGTVKMKFKGRAFSLDLSKLSFKGNATSTGSDSVSCAKTYHDLPQWSLPDVQPKSPGNGSSYGLDAFKGKRIILMMGAGWCASCMEQAKIMEKVNQELIAAGRTDVQMLALIDPNQTQPFTDAVSFPCFAGDYKVHKQPMLDGSTHDGFKNDGYAYDADGRFMGFFQGYDTVYTNLFEDFVRQNVGADKSSGTTCVLNKSNMRGCAPTATP